MSIFGKPEHRDARGARTASGGKVGSTESRPTGRFLGRAAGRQRLGSERAFSLIEVSFAMGLLGLVLVGMLGGLNWVVSSVQRAQEDARAAQLMEEKLDTLRLYSWDQLNTPGFIQTNFTATASTLSNGTNAGAGFSYQGNIIISSAPLTESYSNALKQVTVTLQWTSGGRIRRTQMATFVAQYGMQTFIY